MYSRWQAEDRSAPLRPQGCAAALPPSSRIDFGSAPILDLEGQLNAELDGISWAVLAFAPEDTPWADWLYRNLNGYPLPATLTAASTSHGLPRPDCISIFPDRHDPQHVARYPRALEKSGYLVVVCSPFAAHCAEVDARIRAFKNAGGEERIIALVVEGEPDGSPENAPRTVAPEWLPVWLRWRLSGDSFAEADRGEPVIVDARPGRAGLKEIRDLLLATLIEVDAWELEVAGALARPVEMVRPAPPPDATLPPPPTDALVAAPKSHAERGTPRKIGFTVLVAALCLSATLITAWWSFGRIETDRPPALSAPVRAVAKKGAQPALERLAVPEPTLSEDHGSQIEQPGNPANPAQGAPVISDPARTEPLATTPPAVSVPLVAPVAAVAAVPPATQIARQAVPPPPPVAPAAPSLPAPNRRAMVTMHQRGDEALSERRLDDALDFYEQAVESIRVSGGNSTPDSRTEAALLCRKLGTLQLQMASTAEARNSFVEGRKILIQIKKEGHWNAARAKVLAEIENSLRRLPRD